jgi:LemA protein
MRAAAARRCQAIAASKVAEVEQMENALSEELSNVLAIAETYPQLKSSQQFGAIWRELERVEAAVQEAKDRYNAAAEFYNRRARRIPGGLVAAWMKPRSFDCLGLERVDFDADLTRMGEFAA